MAHNTSSVISGVSGPRSLIMARVCQSLYPAYPPNRISRARWHPCTFDRKKQRQCPCILAAAASCCCAAAARGCAAALHPVMLEQSRDGACKTLARTNSVWLSTKRPVALLRCKRGLRRQRLFLTQPTGQCSQNASTTRRKEKRTDDDVMAGATEPSNRPSPSASCICFEQRAAGSRCLRECQVRRVR